MHRAIDEEGLLADDDGDANDDDDEEEVADDTPDISSYGSVGEYNAETLRLEASKEQANKPSQGRIVVWAAVGVVIAGIAALAALHKQSAKQTTAAECTGLTPDVSSL